MEDRMELFPRQSRRAYRRRMAKIKRYGRLRKMHPRDRERLALPENKVRLSRLKEQPKGCSCRCCGNPRRHSSSAQYRGEVISLLTMREGISELEIASYASAWFGEERTFIY